MKPLAAAVLATLLCACAATPAERSDWERKNVQPESEAEAEKVDLPAFPRASSLVEFKVTGGTQFRFFIDRTTLSVNGGLVRYALVARSPDGIDNVSYEAMRCRTGDYRRYAGGRPDGTWAPVAVAGWRPFLRWHHALQQEYFCPQGQPIASAAEGAAALENGGHPFAESLGAANRAGRR